MRVKLSLHEKKFSQKPQNEMVAVISNQIADCQYYGEIADIALKISEQGQTFCPDIFSKGSRNAEDFLEM